MCGFYGHIISDKDPLKRISDIGNIDKALFNRGPDSKGLIYFDSQNFLHDGNNSDIEGFLFFRRLAIQDLDERSNQPFLSTNKKISLVFNGEIYNFKELRDDLIKLGHKFNTKSDTEVVINSYLEWGRECFKKFRGMFAIVLVDLREQKILLARDQFGIKPLFFSGEPGTLRFGSSLLSILSSNKSQKFSINEQIIQDFISSGVSEKYVQTSIKEIWKVDPAQHIEIKFAEIVSLTNQKIIDKGQYYWHPLQKNEGLSFNEAVEQTRETLRQSIKRHMVSDVPVTNTLSGGIDSSTILALASEISEGNEPIISFGYINNDVEKDNEEIFMETIRQKYGSELRKIFIDQEYFYEKLDDFLSTQFEPVTNLSPFAQFAVYERISNDGFKVALDGQGADEVFLGYGKHLDTYLTYLINNKRFGQVIEILKGSDMGRNTQSVIMILRIKNAIKSIKDEKDLDFVILKNMVARLDEETLPLSANSLELLNAQYESNDLIPTQKNLIDLQKELDIYSSQRLEFYRSGLQQLLSFEDKNAMRFSVENRVPFLDVDIYELIFSLKSEYLISNKGLSKYVLRESMKDLLPDSILQRRRKLGLTTPQAKWNKYLGNELIEIDNNEFILDVPWLNQNYIKELIGKYTGGDESAGGILFRLYTCSKFYSRIRSHLR